MTEDVFFHETIILENQRVKLVPLSEQHEEGLRSIIFDEELWKFSIQCRSEEDVRNYINKTMEHRKAGRAYPFVVIDKQTNEVAGATRFGNIVFPNKRLEIGWTWYGSKFRGSGLNQACKFELLNYAFEQMHFRRVQFSADVDNLRSQKAILKLGAKQEGIFRANYINAAGESRDDVYFSIIHSEWEANKNRIFKDYL